MKRIIEVVRAFMTAAALVFVTQAATAQNLDGPIGMAVDSGSNLYVANIFGSDVAVYNSSLTKVATITDGLEYPTAVAIDRIGTIYVANDLSNSVTEYERPGYHKLSTVITTGISNPIQLVTGASDELYVVNTTPGAGVSVFDLLGNYLFGGGAGTTTVALIGPYIQFWSAPSSGSNRAELGTTDAIDIASDHNIGFLSVGFYTTFVPTLAASNSSNGDMWVTDFGDVQVVHLDQQGDVLASFKPSNPPYGIAVDPVKQRLFVSEPSVNQVEVFNLKTLARETVLK